MARAIFWAKLVFMSLSVIALYISSSSINRTSRPLHVIRRKMEKEDHTEYIAEHEMTISEFTMERETTFGTTTSRSSRRTGYRATASTALSSSTTTLKECERRKNVAFIKTHKTAGSVVQNVLLRYSMRHDLYIAFPYDAHDFRYPNKFNRQMVIPDGHYPHNIICHHMRFEYNELRNYMPKDAIYVTMLREPGSHFESVYSYHWPDVPAFQEQPQNRKESAERWLDNADEYTIKARSSPFQHFAKNPNFFDLGYDHLENNDVYIMNSIRSLSEVFDLVLIAEYFEESMVLLADALCWKLEDVVYFKLNAQTKAKVNASDGRHARIQKKARKWNKADAALYDFFNSTFWRRVAGYGRERMRESVRRLRALNDRLKSLCVEGGAAVDFRKLKDKFYKRNIFIPKGVSVKGYNLKRGAKKLDICVELTASENFLSRKVFSWQISPVHLPNYT